MRTIHHNEIDTRRVGFTLIEMVLVMSIIVVIAAMALPLVLENLRQNRMRKAANDVYQELSSTRLHAIDAGLTYQFRFEPGGRNYLVIPYERDADDLEENSGFSGNTSSRRPRISRRLPEGLTFDVEDAENGDSNNLDVARIRQELLSMLPNGGELRDVQWSPPILFFPDGSSQQSMFIVIDKNEKYMRLSVRELTGAVTLSKIMQKKRF